MFAWIKKLFGLENTYTHEHYPVKHQEEAKPEVKVEIVEEKPTQVKKPAKKATKDLSSMTKKELLDYAKTKKVKCNSSMKKQEIVEAIESALS